ncbi:hypothetical protein HID58_029598 [Brassica napus]|uniref:Dof zinc finger protein n=1 Tax=Brassica napus TaxID=3708 RepID=A0ABQ8CDJ6_BRANA|nr:hypothetical protein HID58_029598 [Brassica napus]
MDYSSVLAEGGNEVNQEKPPPRVCPRCNSTNTKFCYYNNHSVSQPRYKCKECRRNWTHGGALRNIPIGGSGRKKKSTMIDQPFVSQAVSAEIQQVSRRRQPFLHAQKTNQFVEYFGGSSYGFDVDNHVDYYNVESNDLIGNHLNNQSIGNHLINTSIGSYNVVSSNHNSYINQEHRDKWNQSLNNTMNMNHNASTSGSREWWDTDHMNNYNGNIKKNCVAHRNKLDGHRDKSEEETVLHHNRSGRRNRIPSTPVAGLTQDVRRRYEELMRADMEDEKMERGMSETIIQESPEKRSTLMNSDQQYETT